MQLTAGDVIFKLAEQSQGLIEPRDIWPLGCSNPLCDTGVFLVHTDEATHKSGFVPATQLLTPEEYREGYSPDSPQGSVFLDILSKRGVKVKDGLSVIIMNYMDAYSMDVQRLRECSMMVTVPPYRRRWAPRVPAVVQGGAALACSRECAGSRPLLAGASFSYKM